MSARGLQRLLASSLTNGNHRLALLGRNPADYQGFDLSSDEVAVLLGIRATTLEEFALQAHRLFYAEDLLVESSVRVPAPLTMIQALDCA